MPWSRIGAECGSGFLLADQSTGRLRFRVRTAPCLVMRWQQRFLAQKRTRPAAVDGGAADVLIPGLPIDELLEVPGVPGLAVGAVVVPQAVMRRHPAANESNSGTRAFRWDMMVSVVSRDDAARR